MKAMNRSVVVKRFQVSVMLFQVKDCSFKVGDVVAEVAQGSVTGVAKKASDFSCGVAVIDAPSVFCSGSTLRITPQANCTSTLLPLLEFNVIVKGDSIGSLDVVRLSGSGHTLRLQDLQVTRFALAVSFVVLGKRFRLPADLTFFHEYKRATLSIGSGWRR